MISRHARTALALAAAASLVGCIDADVQTRLNADGSGSMKVRMGLTEGMVDVVAKMKQLDPKDDSLKELQMLDVKAPTDADRAAMKKAGLELITAESVADDKAISSKLEVAFARLSGLQQLSTILGEDDDNPGDGMRLVRESDGTYVLSMSGGDDEEDEDPFGLEDMDEDEDEDDGGMDDDPDGKKAALAMEMMGAMMSEISKLKLVIAMEVPGEVVSFSPAGFGKKDGQKVTWTIDFASMMAAAGNGEEPSMEDGFSVRFRMPEGAEIPESALWSGPAKDPAKDAEAGDETGGDSGDDMK